MPVFRIVYIDDDTFAPRTLSAAFADRAAAEIAMAKHGHRIVHVAELGAGESLRDPVAVAMAPECDASAARSPAAEDARVDAAPRVRFASYDLAGAAAVAAGIALLGAALLLF